NGRETFYHAITSREIGALPAGRLLTAAIAVVRSNTDKETEMKTLTTIIATGALLAAVAPTAGAKNALVQCSVSAKHAASQIDQGGGGGGSKYRRNLLENSTCKALQSLKATTGLTPAIKQQIAWEIERDSL